VITLQLKRFNPIRKLRKSGLLKLKNSEQRRSWIRTIGEAEKEGEALGSDRESALGNMRAQLKFQREKVWSLPLERRLMIYADALKFVPMNLDARLKVSAVLLDKKLNYIIVNDLAKKVGSTFESEKLARTPIEKMTPEQVRDFYASRLKVGNLPKSMRLAIAKKIMVRYTNAEKKALDYYVRVFEEFVPLFGHRERLQEFIEKHEKYIPKSGIEALKNFSSVSRGDLHVMVESEREHRIAEVFNSSDMRFAWELTKALFKANFFKKKDRTLAEELPIEYAGHVLGLREVHNAMQEAYLKGQVLKEFGFV